MYLLHHEEIESLAKIFRACKRIRFFMTFGQSYLTHMKCLENVGMLSTHPDEFERTRDRADPVLKGTCFRILLHLDQEQ